MPLAFPKPKDAPRKPQAIITYRDGREVCNLATAEGKREYGRRIVLMWERQRHVCCLCHQPLRLSQAVFEHEAGRGHGGGHRDDRVSLPDGTWINGAAHWACNLEKGSKRGNYNRWQESQTH